MLMIQGLFFLFILQRGTSFEYKNYECVFENGEYLTAPMVKEFDSISDKKKCFEQCVAETDANPEISTVTHNGGQKCSCLKNVKDFDNKEGTTMTCKLNYTSNYTCNLLGGRISGSVVDSTSNTEPSVCITYCLEKKKHLNHITAINFDNGECKCLSNVETNKVVTPSTSHYCKIDMKSDEDSSPSPWSQCSLPCGNGTRTRNTTCSDNKNCTKEPLTEQCNVHACSTDWSSWSPCKGVNISTGNGSEAAQWRTLQVCEDAITYPKMPDVCTVQPYEVQSCKCSDWSRCSLLLPKLQNGDEKSVCGNGFKTKKLSKTECGESTGMIIESCYAPCFDIGKLNTTNITLKEFTKTEEDLKKNTNIMVLIETNSHTEFGLNNSNISFENIASNLLLVSGKLNGLLFLTSVQVEIGSENKNLPKLEYLSHLHKGLETRILTNKTIINDEKYTVDYFVPNTYPVVDEVKLSFTNTKTFWMNLQITGYLPGTWGDWNEWVHKMVNSKLEVSRTRDCYMNESKVLTRFCIGRFIEYRVGEAQWNLNGIRWSECKPENSSNCGKSVQSPIIDCVDKVNGQVIEETFCPSKHNVSARVCYKPCQDACTALSDQTVTHNEYVDGNKTSIEIGKNPMIIKTITIKFCNDKSKRMENYHVSLLLINATVSERMNKTWQTCQHESISGNFYTINGYIYFSFNRSLSEEFNITIKTSGCDFPRPKWKRSECSGPCGNETLKAEHVCASATKEYSKEYCFEDLSPSRRERCQVPCYKWGEWSEPICSEKCGYGANVYNRSCFNGTEKVDSSFCNAKHGGNESLVNGTCFLSPCYEWGNWTNEGCNKTCGVGSNIYKRTCVTNKTNVESEHCIKQLGGPEMIANGSCTGTECYEWGNWTSHICKKNCAKILIRECFNTVNDSVVNNTLCANIDDGKNTRRNGTCPPSECVGFTDWSTWGECSKSCDRGHSNRTRECVSNDEEFCKTQKTIEKRVCNDFPCPLDGKWLEWTEWTLCPVTCGRGQISRTRKCQEPLFGGKNCTKEPKFESQVCGQKLENCPGIYATNRSCEDFCNMTGLKCRPNMEKNFGSKEMYKEVNLNCNPNITENQKYAKGYDPSFNMISKECQGYIGRGNISCTDVPPDSMLRLCYCENRLYDYEPWTLWGECSQSCGNSIRTRLRYKYDRKNPENKEEEPQKETCKTSPCPINGNWGKWSEYTLCSKSCGFGRRKRWRKCNDPPPSYNGSTCPGIDTTENDCLLREICPVDGGWSFWSQWTACDQPCNGGTMKRYRACNNPVPEFGGKECEGSRVEKQKCVNEKCISSNIDVELVFTNEKWNPDLEDLNSQAAKKFKERLEKSLRDIYFSNNGNVTRGELSITIHELRNGGSPIEDKENEN